MSLVIVQQKCPYCHKTWVLKHDGGHYAEFVEASHQVGFRLHVLMEHGEEIEYVGRRSDERRAV